MVKIYSFIYIYSLFSLFCEIIFVSYFRRGGGGGGGGRILF